MVCEHGYKADVKRLGIPDRIVEHGSQDQLYAECEYDDKAMVKAAVELVGDQSKKSSGKAFA